MDAMICEFERRSNLSLCEYVTAECSTSYYFLAQKVLCSRSDSSRALLMATSLAILSCVGVMIVMIGITSSMYLFTSVMALTDSYNVRREMLGYIVVPLMNGAPDILSCHTMIKGRSMNLVIGQIIGANLISFTIIVGCISILRPFTVSSPPAFLLGYCFVAVMIISLSYVLWDGRITIIECLLLGFLYPIHVMFSSVGETSDSSMSVLEAQISKDLITESSQLLRTSSQSEELYDSEPTSLGQARSAKVPGTILSVLDYVIFLVLPVSNAASSLSGMPVNSLKSQLRSSVWFQAWITIISTAIINKSTLELSTNVLQVVICATFCITKVLSFILVTEHRETLLNIVSITTSLSLMTIIARALICLLKNFGAIWQISEFIMGLVVYSLVSSLNDVLMNLSLALNISPSAGIASCVSSCCLLISIGIGFNGLWELTEEAFASGHFDLKSSLSVSLTPELYSSLVALNFTILPALAYVWCNEWTLDKSLGICLISSWILTTFACIIMEFKW